MNLDDIEFLTSDAGSRLLDDLAAEDVAERNTLSLLTRLRKNHSPQQAGAASRTHGADRCRTHRWPEHRFTDGGAGISGT